MIRLRDLGEIELLDMLSEQTAHYTRMLNEHVKSREFYECKRIIEKVTEEAFIAKSGFSFRSWGEQITIIWEKDKILFNSICDPDRSPSIASFGMNRKNRKTFESFLKLKG